MLFIKSLQNETTGHINQVKAIPTRTMHSSHAIALSERAANIHVVSQNYCR